MRAAVTTWTGRRSTSQAIAALTEAGVRFEPAHQERLVLLDTFDGRLHRAGMRLVWHSGRGSELILTAAGSPDARLPVDAAPRFDTELPAGPFRARLHKLTDVRALLPLIDLSGSVAVGAHTDRAGKTTATVILRRRPTLAGSAARMPTWTIEVRPLMGYEKHAHRIEAALESVDLARTDGDVIDLAVRAAGVDPAGITMSPTVRLDPTTPAIDGVRRVLLHLLEAMEVNWQGTIDDIDPEFLHDLRVAVRRARSVLAQASGVLPDADRDDARVAFGGLGEITGPSRDLDVFVIEWDTYLAPLPADQRHHLDPALELIIERRAEAHEQLSAALREAEAVDLLGTWRRRFALDPPEASSETDEASDRGDTGAPEMLGPFVAARIRRAQRRLLRNGRAIDIDSPGEQLHDLRKDAKRLRYLIECFGGLLDSGSRKRFVGHLKALQDNLGEHQDAEVHVASLRDLGHELERRHAGADALLALGQLTELIDQRRLAARAEFADRFTAYDTKATKTAFEALLDSLEPAANIDEDHARGAAR